METSLRTSLAISCLYVLWIAVYASNPSKDSLGIAPQDEGYYKSSMIYCKDGSKKFTREQLNDEFCDCPDGTDEPGTSACPEGKFYCRNAGHAPLTIFSSRVNDGICDCCDGSDEYQNNVKCLNTCWEAGKAAREKLKKKIVTYQEGVTLRRAEVEKSKQAFAKDEAELEKLKSEEKVLNGLVQKLKEHKERIEKAENEERQKKEEEERQKKEEEEKRQREEAKESNVQEITPEKNLHANIEATHADMSGSTKQDNLGHSHDTSPEPEFDGNVGVETSDDHAVKQLKDAEIDNDDRIAKTEIANDATVSEASSADEILLVKDQHDQPLDVKISPQTETHDASLNPTTSQEQESSTDSEQLSREDLGRLVASRWTGESAAQKTNVDNSAKEEELKNNLDKLDSDSAPEDFDDNYSSETDENRTDHSDGDHSDDEYEDEQLDPIGSYKPDDDEKTDFSDLSLSTRPSWLDKIHQTVQNVLQAFNFFKTPVDISEGDRVRKEYDDSSSNLSKIQSRISSLTEKLKHDFGKEKEFYSFYGQCLEIKQNKYVYKVCPFKQATQVEGHTTTRLGNWDKFEESYRIMQFSNGDRCWNGPDRSLKVKLRCGLKNELADVDEPSRCEYVALLSTPVLCEEEKLKELEQKLEQMNSNQPPNHDEL